LSLSGLQEAQKAYMLWKARQMVDQLGSGTAAVLGAEKYGRSALVDFAIHGLKEDLFSEVMDYMWNGGCPQSPTPMAEGRTGFRKWAWTIATRFQSNVTRWFQR
jgi:hypothetical protein